MYTSGHDHNNAAISHLPKAFEQALRRVNQSDGFSEAVTYAAELADCEFLFEIPGALFGDEKGRAAVMRSRELPDSSDSGQMNDAHIFYIVFDGENGVIRIIEEFEVPLSIYEMTHSYSRVLEFLASHLNGTSRSSHQGLN